MTAFLTCLQALAWLIVGITAIAFLAWVISQAGVRVLMWREARDRKHDAEDAETWPLPAVDADDAAFDDWGRNVIGLRQRPVPFRESETFARIAAAIAHNEAQRTDFDGWADVFGEGA